MNIINLQTGEPFDETPRFNHREPSLEGASSVSSRGRNLLGLRGAMMGGAVGWKNPYVTDGLVAMWDGEWNAGGGVHDATATTWKDLIGGCGDFDVSAATVGANNIYLNKIVLSTHSDEDEESSSAEIVAEPISSSYYSNIINFGSQRIGTGNTTIGTLSSRSFYDYSGAEYSDVYELTTGDYWHVYYSGIVSLSRNYVKAVWNPSSTIYVNDSAATFTRVSGNYVYTRTGSIEIGDTLLQMRVYCVRFYNRHLTDDERSANYAVDVERFGIV